MRKTSRKIVSVITLLLLFSQVSQAQLPGNVLVGYLEGWNNLKLSQVHANYNVLCLAFAYDPPTYTVGYDIAFDLPTGYTTDAALMADIDLMHSQGKVVLLSLGGGTAPIRLTSVAERNTFISSINNLFTRFGNKLDGLDLDLEGQSMAFGASWTITAPAAGQTYMADAVKSIMATYLSTNSKKMILTAAPEVLYLMGGMSAYQVTNYNGGAFLPILNLLRNEIDLLQMQLYNAGGATGGVYGWDGNLYYDNGTADFALAMNEAIVKGFTCASGKGVWAAFPASKIAFGFPATPAASTAGTGYVTPAEICKAVKYFRGTITKPTSITYTLATTYPLMKGLMTWSMNEDKNISSPTWNFAINTSCAISAPVTLASFEANRANEDVFINWLTLSETDNHYFSVERSSDGVSFAEISRIQGLGTSTVGKNYEYLDQNNTSKINYYRLAQYDFDGTVHYTQVVTVGPSAAGSTGLHFNSNPFTDALTVWPYGESVTNQEGVIQVTDYTGKILTNQAVRISGEYNIGADYVPGLYILNYQFNGEITRYKIVKQ